MKVQVTINNVKIIKETGLNENEYNIHEFEFEFVEEYEGLTKKAVFTDANEQSYIETIVNNKCSVPTEVLHKNEYVTIGVYAYEVENEELKLRYSPQPTHFFVNEGSYKSVNNSTPPTPSEIEQLQSQITQNSNDIDVLEGNILNLQEEQVEQNRNIQSNADDIEEIQQEQIIQNTNIQKNTDDIVNINQAINTINADITNMDSAIDDINEDIDNLEQGLINYSLITETGSQINLNVNSTNYQITAILKDKNGNVIYTSNAIDLPIESMIINASYDNTTKEIVLTLQNGNTLRISVADLVSGLVSETQLQTILANYYTRTEVDNLLSALAGRVSTNEEDIADIKEEQTTQNTNIEELQNQVATLQEDLESANSEIAELNTDITNMRKAMITVEGQGSDITLENTSENKFVEFGLEGRTEQDGEATLENPVPIKNVTGNSNVKIQNKNLVDESDANLTYVSGAYVRWNDTEKIIESSLGALSGQFYIFEKPLEAGKTYTLIVKFKQGYIAKNSGLVNIGLYHLGSPSSWQGRIEFSDLVDKDLKDKTFKVTYTATETVTGIYIFIYGNTKITTELKFNVLVAEGTTATSYVPHKEQNYPFTFAQSQRAMQGTQLNDDGIHKKRYKFYPTEITGINQHAGTGLYYCYVILPQKVNNAELSNMFSTHFRPIYGIAKGQFYFSSQTTLVFTLNDQTLTTKEAVDNWLQAQVNNGTPVEFELVLDNSELENNIIPYNATQQAQYNNIKANATSEDDITIISSESDELGFDMKAIAVADANKVIDKELQEIKSAVIALGGDINV